MSRLSRARTLFGALIVLSALVWCVQYTARASPGSPPTDVALASPLASFEGDAPIADSVEWLTRRVPLLRQAFLNRIYGAVPDTSSPSHTRHRIDASALGGRAALDLLTLDLGGSQSNATLDVALFTPTGQGPFPLIIASDFCGLDADIDQRLPAPSWRPQRCRTALGRAVTQFSHGDAILRPPVEDMVARGYAVAIFFAGDVVPDDPILFREAQVNRHGDEDTGAIADWASLYLNVFDLLRLDPRVSATEIALWGHSRYGKAALLAAALDDRVGAVIANQSGTFGATLSSATRGESATQIVRRFPHWFPQRLGATSARDLNGLDQHFLLALLAPRPVLLGNAGLDRWSDPASAFEAARAASGAYGLFGSTGLSQPTMREPDISADIAFYVRPGGHGVRSSDWTRALDFLDHHFTAPEIAPPT